MLKTQVAIIGGGPSGVLLALLLAQEGIAVTVLERASRVHVLARIRAGVLESTTVDLLHRAGVGERLGLEGKLHRGTGIAWGHEQTYLIDSYAATQRYFTTYGQTAIQEDLYAAAEARGLTIHFDVSDIEIDGLTDNPRIRYQIGQHTHTLACDFIAGCDGFHGISRQAIPNDILKTFERTYPFGWMGVLSETKPLDDIWYVHHADGFALASMRNPKLSRYYVQCPADDRLEDWSDDRFWETLLRRFPSHLAAQIETGPSIEKSIAPLRSFVAEPMRYGALFLVGDAAHIVPPTGAKGLNLACSDVYYLWRGLTQWYQEKDPRWLDAYSPTALTRVWKTVRFSWWLTNLLHCYPDQTPFDLKTQESELASITESPAGRQWFAEQYAGYPIEDWG